MASIKQITTPDFGGAAEVTVIEILVKPGDKIEVDTPIVTLESDKATMELPSTDAGIVKDIKVKVGDKVETGSVILTVESQQDKTAPKEKVSEKTSAKSSASQEKAEKPAKDELHSKEKAEKSKTIKQEAQQDQKQKTPPKKESVEIEEETEEPKVLTGTVQTESDIHAGPGVRRMARELGVNLSQVTGTGPKNRVLKEDVQTYVKSQLTQTALTPFTSNLPSIDFSKFGQIESQTLSRIKKISGKNLQRNWMMIPHVTQFAEADITTLEDFRQSQKKQLEKDKVKLTPLVFVMKAVVATLKAFPQFNASLDASGEHLILKKYFHIGIAVDTPEGLVVPVIRDVDKKGLIDLAKELADVSEKARQKQLTPAAMQGGCFSISSLGGIGGTAFTPIINYPEVAILGVSQANMKPIYQDGTFVPRLMLPLSLSYDHRVVDGAEGARFIVYLTRMLSDIRNLLL